jgi:hypothetical protein
MVENEKRRKYLMPLVYCLKRLQVSPHAKVCKKV